MTISRKKTTKKALKGLKENDPILLYTDKIVYFKGWDGNRIVYSEFENAAIRLYQFYDVRLGVKTINN